MKELASIIGGFIVAALLAIAALYVFSVPPKDITLKDIPQGIAPQKNITETATQGTTLNKSPEKEGDKKVQVDYYIIVGSVRNLTQAKQKAEELINEYNTNFIVLPPSTKGYYRVSSGVYSTLEEAKSTIKSIRANINPDAWIFSVKRNLNIP
jgi:hypothetical protein